MVQTNPKFPKNPHDWTPMTACELRLFDTENKLLVTLPFPRDWQHLALFGGMPVLEVKPTRAAALNRFEVIDTETGEWVLRGRCGVYGQGAEMSFDSLMVTPGKPVTIKTFRLGYSPPPGPRIEVQFSVEDVIDRFSGTSTEAGEWLVANGKHLTDLLVQRGNEIIDEMLEQDGKRLKE